MQATPPGSAAEADYSLRHYVLETFEVVTSADSRVVRTFRTLVARPGTLTAAYFSQDRDTYLRPQQVLLFSSVFYFFAQPLVGFTAGFSAPLRVHLGESLYRGWAVPRVRAEVARRGGDLSTFQQVFDAAASGHARTLTFMVVPLFALLLTLLFWRPRRFFVEHLVFSTHYVAFLLLALPAQALLLTKPLTWALHSLKAPAGLVPLATDLLPTMALLLAYLYPAVGRAYGHGRWLSACKAVALSLGMMYVIMAYRFILFVTSFYGM
jgi:hypothetical protein